MSSPKRPALGRGLSALIPEIQSSREQPGEIDLDLLDPNPFQPRAAVDDESLDELARSIKAAGVLQPVLVRRKEAGRFEIIAGERRWRAAQRAGLLKVPILVRAVDNEQLLALALIENIQRADLNPIEEARGYERLLTEFGLTQEQVAAAVGKDRSSVANYVRLLKLPAELQAEIAAATLSMGHARALLALPDEASQLQAGRDVIARRLSVRETEALVRKRLEPPDPAPPRQPPVADVHTRVAEDRLRLALGTRVRIVRRGVGGRLEIDFTSEEELNRLYEQLTR